MTSIKLTVTGAKARAEVAGLLTSGMDGTPVTIEYDNAWECLTKNLVCMCREDVRDPGVIRTILNVGNNAVVAHEVILSGRELYLGIEGHSADGKLVVPTTWAYCGKIQPGANADADPSADPQLPVWAQLQSNIINLKSKIEELNDESSCENSDYVLPIGGDELGGVRNGGNVVINAYGTMTAPEVNRSANYNPMAGKYLSILGDSISTYPGYIPEGYSCYYAANFMNSVTYMWWHRLITALGMNLCVNNAYSGSCVAVKAGVADGYSGCNTVRNMRLHTDTRTPDIIIVQMGTNDYVQKIPIGDYELADGEVFDTSTFMGAYAKMLWNISSKYPNTKVYCATLPKMRSVRDTEYPVSGMEVYNDAIRKVADMFGAGIMDFASCSTTSSNVPNYMTDGRIHPSKDGQALMGNKAIEEIAPFIATRYGVLAPVVNSDATLDDGDDGGSGGTDPDVPEVTLSSISVAYSGGSVPVGTAVSGLTGLVVTAHYSDGTSEAVTGYALSGTIAEGSNTVTVTYQGMTTTFTVTGVAESGGGDSGEEDTRTYIAQYDFTAGNSNDLVGTMNGTDTEITYTADGAVFGAKSLMAFGKYDLSNKTVEIDMGSVTGETGLLFCANNFESFLGRGLKFENTWTYLGADQSVNTTELTDVQAVANKTLKLVYGASESGYIPVEVFFGDTSIICVEKGAYTGGYMYLGTGSTTLPMTIRAMRILA